jgi:photoactive yellow protein
LLHIRQAPAASIWFGPTAKISHPNDFTTLEIVQFASNDLDNLLSREPQRAEYLPFGAVLLTRTGKIISYSKAAGLPGSRTPENLIGLDFFNDVARCARRTNFHRNFQKYQRLGVINLIFDYKLFYQGERVGVTVHLKSCLEHSRCWLFIKLTAPTPLVRRRKIG